MTTFFTILAIVLAMTSIWCMARAVHFGREAKRLRKIADGFSTMQKIRARDRAEYNMTGPRANMFHIEDSSMKHAKGEKRCISSNCLHRHTGFRDNPCEHCSHETGDAISYPSLWEADAGHKGVA